MSLAGMFCSEPGSFCSDCSDKTGGAPPFGGRLDGTFFAFESIPVSGPSDFSRFALKLKHPKRNMNRETRSRFAELGLAIVLVVIALVWAERWAWNQIATLRREVNVEQVDRVVAFDRAEATQFLATANAGLTRLQRLLFLALLCLLISGVVLVLLAYGRMIAPLRNTLTESRAAIERQEKLASLGVFATGIAHEIRNPLTAIKVRLFSLKQSHRPGHQRTKTFK